MKRIIALALTVVMCLSLLTGCGATGLKIDGKNVDLGYYAYFFGYSYPTYAMEGSEFISGVAMESLKQFIAVKNLAKELKVELEPLERKAVIDSINAQVNEMGKSNWNMVLNALDLTEKQFLDIQYNYTLMNKLRDYFYNRETGVSPLTNDQVAASYKEQFIHCRHILINTQTAQSEADFGKALKTADEAYKRAAAGEDFVELMHEYSEDPGQPDEGYYFTEGQMVTQFEDAAYALAEGEISEPIQSTYGYHIIQRLPVEDEYALSQVDTYYDYYASIEFAKKIDAITAEMEVETTEEFYNYDLSNAVGVFGSGS